MKWNKPLILLFAGFTLGSLITLFIHPFLSFFIPIVGLAGFSVTYLLNKKSGLTDSRLLDKLPADNTSSQQADAIPLNEVVPANNRFEEVMNYLSAIETMVTEEGRNNNLDQEIVRKSLELTAKIRKAVAEIEPFQDGEMDYTITRLVTKDLNALVNPFLRLSGELKVQNRRILLDGLKDIHSKLDSIFSAIQQQDLLDLRTKGDVIRSRYSTKSF
ncbi:hypothetical protein [Paenibacillus sp. N3.4]|uniref:hypothetical protein n=1 Tax=Paenibacillus sp. N3.4 TaxID=2603222 RepID=UPI0011C70C66|nr:hypothetical protein [Paenibacillus sp. N3.4]TXK68940.1 hypothetical protein FU659_34200 [Paenibacillus sp. N3.4]